MIGNDSPRVVVTIAVCVEGELDLVRVSLDIGRTICAAEFSQNGF